jgi:hypothetical protein
MRAWLMTALALLLFLNGCKTQQSLRENTVVTAATLADVNYQQILDNVAMFVDNPAVLPSFATIGSGAVTVADHCTVNVAPNYVPTLAFAQQIGAGLPILSIFFNPTYDRLVTENWSLTPVQSAHRLRDIGCAFQLLVSNPEDGIDLDCVRHLQEALLAEDEPLEVLIPRGWYCIGKKHDVPKDACYVGHHCQTYVWVMHDGVGGLSRFMLTGPGTCRGRPGQGDQEAGRREDGAVVERTSSWRAAARFAAAHLWELAEPHLS